MAFKLNVNGHTSTVDAPADMPLLWVLRDMLDLRGTKYGCGIGQCGACTVHLGGQPVRACLTPLSMVKDQPITTLEGLSADGTHPVQLAWQEIDVPQCGYCQAGQMMSAAALLAKTPQANRQRHRHRDDRQPLPLRNLYANPRARSTRRRNWRPWKPPRARRQPVQRNK